MEPRADRQGRAAAVVAASEDPADTQTLDDTNWLELFGLDDNGTEPFDGSDAMQP